MEQVFRIELGSQTVSGHCGTCGHEARTFRGFVSDQEGASAVYLATYTESHPEAGVVMAVSIGGWGEGADPVLRECVVLEWRNGAPGCRVIDAATSCWGGCADLGRMLSRDQAMASGRAREAFAISDAVGCQDARLPAALGSSRPVCAICGQAHSLDTVELAFKLPEAVVQLSDTERSAVQQNRDICIIRGQRFFLRATLPMPVPERDDDYHIGVWVELAQLDFERIYELWDDPQQSAQPPFAVTLANSIPTLPETLGLVAELQLVSPQSRPRVQLLVGDHPLMNEQKMGISAHRAHEYSAMAS
ncbi:DUF2199 domain-containing protein [Pseudomonas sp. TE3610]